MKLSMLLIIPVVVTILVMSLVPYPSYSDAREINANLRLRINPDGGVPDVRVTSNYTDAGYWSHMNAFWTGSVRSNEPPANYSWSLEIIKEGLGGTTDWTARWYYPYDLKGGYWVNVTYSFEGEIHDVYTFIVRLHYNIPMGSGDVEGVYGISHLQVIA